MAYVQNILFNLNCIPKDISIIISGISKLDINSLFGYIIAFLAVLVAVFGWIVQHKLNIKANEKNFINSIKNQARIEIIKNFRPKEEWLSDVNFLEPHCSLFIYGISTYAKVIDNFTEMTIKKNNSTEWIYILESYEVLFPEITELRKKLVEIGIKTNSSFYSFCSKAFNFTNKSKEEQIAFLTNVFKKYEFSSIFLDLRMLMNDLKIYIQNVTLGTIVNKEAELRIPNDKELPYLTIINKELIIKNYYKYINKINKLNNFLESII